MVKHLIEEFKLDVADLRKNLHQESRAPLDFRMAMVAGWSTRAFPRIIRNIRK